MVLYFNNPVAADHEHLAALDCVYLVYGDELAPTSGTPTSKAMWYLKQTNAYLPSRSLCPLAII